MNLEINTALISVFNKEGLIKHLIHISKILNSLEILSTGGTMKIIKKNWTKMFFKNKILSVEEYTTSPEFPDGLVKTLHPKIFFGLLGDNSKKDHENYYTKFQIKPIDLLISNFYPFEEFLAKSDKNELDYRKHWDIGGPSMVMASIKGGHCLTLTSPRQYKKFENHLQEHQGQYTPEFMKEINSESIKYVSTYHLQISDYFNNEK